MSMEDEYYKTIRIALKMLGVWPYRNSQWINIRPIIITIWLISGVFVQLAVFITHEYNWNLMLEVLSFALPSIFMLLMYDFYYLNPDLIKQIMENIYCDWKKLNNETELNIMDHYVGIVKLTTDCFLSALCIVMLMAAIITSIPITLDIISPLNQSRTHLHLTVEYFTDPTEHYHLFILHLFVFILLGLCTIVCIGLAYFSFGVHAIAMFKIVNNRMENIIDKKTLCIPNRIEREHIICQRIICAVDFHHRALRYCHFLLYYLNIPTSVVTAIGVLSLGINLFRLLNAIMVYIDIMEIFLPFTLVICHMFFLFYGNHIGQQVTNNSNEIFETIYNLPWYLAPLNIQRLLLFLLVKGHKTLYITLGGIFDASYEGFAALTKLSMSYFTLMRAVQ